MKMKFTPIKYVEASVVKIRPVHDALNVNNYSGKCDIEYIFDEEKSRAQCIMLI